MPELSPSYHIIMKMNSLHISELSDHEQAWIIITATFLNVRIAGIGASPVIN